MSLRTLFSQPLRALVRRAANWAVSVDPFPIVEKAFGPAKKFPARLRAQAPNSKDGQPFSIEIEGQSFLETVVPPGGFDGLSDGDTVTVEGCITHDNCLLVKKIHRAA